MSSYNYFSNGEISLAHNEISGMNNDIRRKVLFFQGLILDLQRKAGKAEKFDSKIYSEIETCCKALEKILEEFTNLKEQVEYTKDIADSIKLSQEIADGFEEKKMTVGIDFSKLITTQPNLNHTIYNWDKKMNDEWLTELKSSLASSKGNLT